MEAAKPVLKATYQTAVFQLADSLFGSEAGLGLLYQRAGRLQAAGAFSGGGWEDPSRLLPRLVRGSLDVGGIYPVVEGLSELRLLSLALGHSEHERLPASAARRFLDEVLALNVDLIFPCETEASRVSPAPWRERAERLFAFLVKHLGLENLEQVLLAEVEAVCVQRPINTRPVRRALAMVESLPAKLREGPLARYARAIAGPSPLARASASLAEYRAALSDLSPAELEREATCFGASLRETGLASRHHAVLLRRLRAKAPQLLPLALRLSELGRAELNQNRELAHQLLRVAVLPSCAQVVYGYARVLERGLLSRPEVAAGLRRLVDLDLSRGSRVKLLSRRPTADGAAANSILVAGALSVLGQPLGVGQGRNPTCQAARGISLWSQHAPGHLLELVASAARDDLIQVRFEEDVLRSDILTGGLAPQIDPDLDPISLILTPHLDRLYDEMMRRVALRSEDGHKWANPGLYGRWISHGFASLIDPLTGAVSHYGDFLRRFYATHHPAFNDGHELIYPNPVGIFVTSAHGDLLGLHAVSIQRVGEHAGTLRVYFFNPNNEGRQDWGQGISPSVQSAGEEEGESSLPFAAFTYNPYEEGDAFAVPQATLDSISRLARESWGRSYPWEQEPIPVSEQTPV